MTQIELNGQSQFESADSNGEIIIAKSKSTHFQLSVEEELRHYFNNSLLYFKVSPDKLTITNIKETPAGSEPTIYLNQWIDSSSKAIAKWTFKMNKIYGRNGIYFGITDKEVDPTEDFAEHGVNYYIGGYGGVYGGMNRLNNIDSFYPKDGDCVSFILDLSLKK